MEKRLVLFDFDGVIGDTFHIGHAVAQKVCVFLTETEYRKQHEGNIHEQIAAVRAADHGDRCDHTLDWLGQYLPEFKLHAKPFAGIPEVIAEFARTHTLAIVSSTHNDLIEFFLQTYGMKDFVDGVYGLDAGPRKDEKFKTIFAKYRIEPADTVFITDTLGDINEASDVGLKSIGVTWGFQDRHTLARGNPYAIADTPQELPDIVRAYFEGR